MARYKAFNLTIPQITLLAGLKMSMLGIVFFGLTDYITALFPVLFGVVLVASANLSIKIPVKNALAIHVAVLSSVMNNTPIVVMFIPLIAALSEKHGIDTRKSFLPLSYISMLGGMTTLMGSSTNLIGAGIAVEYGVKPIGILDISIPALIIAIPLGIYAGYNPDSKASKVIMAGSILGFSMPTFWVGIIFIMIFAVQLGWLPSTGRGEIGTFMGINSSLFTINGLSHVFLPALNLALFKISSVIRLTRAGTREIILQDYITFARSKGISEKRVVLIHVLKNILIPIVTVVGLEFGSLIAFSTVTETVFAWPGMGKLIIDSIYNLDRPVIVAYLMIIVTFFVFLNLIVDIIYTFLDPRVRIKGDHQ